jgi:hypothetical protein
VTQVTDKKTDKTRALTRAFMSNKTRAFCTAYHKTGNATQSYITAGYSPNGAGQSAATLLKKPAVQALLALLSKQSEKKLLLDGQKFMSRLSALGTFDPRELFDQDTGNLLPVKDLPAHVAAGLTLELEGGKVSRIKTASPSTQLAALELYAKVTGMVKPAAENDNRVSVIVLPAPVGALAAPVTNAVGHAVSPATPAEPLLLRPEW